MDSDDVSNSLSDWQLLEFVGDQDKSAGLNYTFCREWLAWIRKAESTEIPARLCTLVRETSVHNNTEEVMKLVIYLDLINCLVLILLSGNRYRLQYLYLLLRHHIVKFCDLASGSDHSVFFVVSSYYYNKAFLEKYLKLY